MNKQRILKRLLFRNFLNTKNIKQLKAIQYDK